MAGILGLPLVLLCAGIAFGDDLSTINPSIGAPARYLFSMSRDGVLPPVIAKLHEKYKTPYVAVLFLGIIMLLFVATGSIIYVASLSLFADLFYYIIGFISLIGILSLIIALLVPGIIDALIYSYTMYTAGVFIPVIGGVLWKGATRAGALSSLIGGSIVALWGILSKANIFGAPAEIYAALVSLVIFVVVSLATQKKLVDGITM
ncbi:MAG: solute:Na+ symporter, family [Thermoanaerobacteraceae bacterium]|nr:solute:Na+ symporter, family [Thermoanaerobacteraceae bacterium]